jgi:O-methyltransferase involved in polyketide biosynthesis
MTEIQDVRGTAFIVAEYRAQENAEQNPLYRDPIVPLFLSEHSLGCCVRGCRFARNYLLEEFRFD